MTPPVRILIADDHPMVRVGLSAVLGYEPGFAVVGLAEDGEQAVTLTKNLLPDVAMLDVRMPKLDGIEVARRIVPAGVRALLLSTQAGAAEVAAGRAAGASGFVLKTAGLGELREAIAAARDGREWLSAEIPAPTAANLLSPRQREVLDLLAAGLSNKEIARALGFTADGTKAHLKAIYAKLGVADRTEAVVAAIRRGLVRVP